VLLRGLAGGSVGWALVGFRLGRVRSLATACPSLDFRRRTILLVALATVVLMLSYPDVPMDESALLSS